MGEKFHECLQFKIGNSDLLWKNHNSIRHIEFKNFYKKKENIAFLKNNISQYLCIYWYTLNIVIKIDNILNKGFYCKTPNPKTH